MLLFLAVIAVLLASTAQAANRYWVGSAGGNTNDTANWAAARRAPTDGQTDDNAKQKTLKVETL